MVVLAVACRSSTPRIDASLDLVGTKHGPMVVPVAKRVQTGEPADAQAPIATQRGGLRRALSMVLALALPPDFPNRVWLVGLTVGPVWPCCRSLVKDPTMQQVSRWFGKRGCLDS
jgi:hypothetical protein